MTESPSRSTTNRLTITRLRALVALAEQGGSGADALVRKVLDEHADDLVVLLDTSARFVDLIKESKDPTQTLIAAVEVYKRVARTRRRIAHQAVADGFHDGVKHLGYARFELPARPLLAMLKAWGGGWVCFEHRGYMQLWLLRAALERASTRYTKIRRVELGETTITVFYKNKHRNGHLRFRFRWLDKKKRKRLTIHQFHLYPRSTEEETPHEDLPDHADAPRVRNDHGVRDEPHGGAHAGEPCAPNVLDQHRRGEGAHLPGV